MLNKITHDNDGKAVGVLFEQLSSEHKSAPSYLRMLCELILKGKCDNPPDFGLKIASTISSYLCDSKQAPAVIEQLYAEVYKTWTLLSKTADPYPNHYVREPLALSETLAWAYKIKLSKEEKVNSSWSVNHFSPEALSAFWEAIKFSQVKSIGEIHGFDEQTPETWRISCAGIASSKLKSLKFDFGYIINVSSNINAVSTDMLRLFWRSVNLANIVNLDLVGFSLTNTPTEFWDITCEGIKGGQLKHLRLERMTLHNLNREQWVKLYQGLLRAKLESLDLTCNHLHHFSFDGYHLRDDQLNSFDVICDIIRLPALRHLRLLQDRFERLNSDGFYSLCRALHNSAIEHLEIAISDSEALSQDNWMIFIYP
jgi:hypothetical protein